MSNRKRSASRASAQDGADSNCWSRLGISADPARPRLGPAQKRALSSDDDECRRYEPTESDQGEEERLSILPVDFKAFARSVGFSLHERAVFLAFFESQVPRSRLGEFLGLTSCQARSLLAEVQKKLSSPAVQLAVRRGRYHSGSLAYAEVLPSGRKSYELAQLPKHFFEIMSREKFSLYSQRDPAISQRIGRFCARNVGAEFLMTVEKLKEKRGEEAAKLGRLSERAQVANLACRAAEQKLEKTEASFSEEQTVALLAEKSWPSIEAQKAIQAARGELTVAQLALSATRGAVAKQADILAAVDGEIEARRLEAFRAALEPKKLRLKAALKELVEASLAMNEVGIIYRVDAYTMAREMFPSPDPLDVLSRFEVRCQEGALVNGALALEGRSLQYGRSYAQ